MSEMVDRVAKAIAEAHDEFFDYDVLARAAIEAMVPATEAMIGEGRAAWLSSASEYPLLAVSTAAAYTAMIDTALKD